MSHTSNRAVTSRYRDIRGHTQAHAEWQAVLFMTSIKETLSLVFCFLLPLGVFYMFMNISSHSVPLCSLVGPEAYESSQKWHQGRTRKDQISHDAQSLFPTEKRYQRWVTYNIRKNTSLSNQCSEAKRAFNPVSVLRWIRVIDWFPSAGDSDDDAGYLDVTVSEVKHPPPQLSPMPEGLTTQQVCVCV